MLLLNKVSEKAISQIKTFIKTIPHKFFSFLELQLFITLLASPILLSWGLPISILSPLGNLLFAPWLTLFLSLSSLLFFMQLLTINNTWVIYLLEKLNQLFFYVLNLADSSFMISCACPTSLILFSIPCALFFLLQFNKSTIYLRVLSLLMFSCILFLSLKYILGPRDLITSILNKNKNILLIKHANQKVLLDCGAFSEGRNPQAWIRYHLIPQLLKLGIDHLDFLIIPHPSSKVFESINELLKNISVKEIQLSQWTGRLPYAGWKCWKSLLDLKKDKGVRITFLNKPFTLHLTSQFLITFQPFEKALHKGPLTYKKVAIEIELNQEIVPISQ